MRRPLPLRPTAVAVGAAAFAALVALGAGGTAVGAASAPTESAQSQYQAAVKAATNQTVHFQTDVTQGKVTLQQSGDAGTTSGSESLTIHNGKSTEHMNAEVVGTTGYVKGNTTGLQNILGLTAAQARKYQDQWLSFPMSNSNLAQLVAGLLKSQVATELSFSGPFTHASDATVLGQHAIGIRGSVSASDGTSVPEILYVPSTGKPLPIEEVTNPGAKAHASSIHGTVSFTNWGERVSVPVPAHSVPLSKLAPKSTSGATTTTGG
jgi:ketosteroid isomerase-like protein